MTDKVINLTDKVSLRTRKVAPPEQIILSREEAFEVTAAITQLMMNAKNVQRHGLEESNMPGFLAALTFGGEKAKMILAKLGVYEEK